jgi:hypothetical protein
LVELKKDVKIFVEVYCLPKESCLLKNTEKNKKMGGGEFNELMNFKGLPLP